MKPMERLLTALAVGVIIFVCLKMVLLERKPKTENWTPSGSSNTWRAGNGTFLITNQDGSVDIADRAENPPVSRSLKPDPKSGIPPNAFVTMDRGTVVLLDSKTGNLLVYEKGKWSTYERKLTNIVSVIHSTGPASIVNNPPRSVDERMHDIANSYFRMGQQAALMARDISEDKAREVRKRYGYFERQGESYTNREDFEIVTERVDCIDHPRIWEIFRKLHDGSVLGLDTNSQCQWANSRPWTVLKD